MTGTPDCGWGSTYGNVSPSGEYTLEDYGRVEVDSITTERDCCLEAMKYEGISLDQGGAAIRFGICGRCRRPREDDAGQPRHERRPLGTIDTCGPKARTCTGATRRARRTRPTSRRAGGASPRAASRVRARRSPPDGPAAREPRGSCRITSAATRTPRPPRRAVQHDQRPAAILRGVPLLEWIADTGGDADPANPCLAWQIVDGKCRILRKECSRAVRRGRPRTPLVGRVGDDGARGGRRVHVRARRASARTTRTTLGELHARPHAGRRRVRKDDCHYYSFMYFRSDAALDTGDANATYRKIMVVEMTEEDEELGLNITAGIVLLPTARASRNCRAAGAEVGSGFEAAFEARRSTPASSPTARVRRSPYTTRRRSTRSSRRTRHRLQRGERAGAAVHLGVLQGEGKMLEVKCKKEDLEEVRQKTLAAGWRRTPDPAEARHLFGRRRQLRHGRLLHARPRPRARRGNSGVRPTRPNRRRTIRRRPMRRRPMRRPRPRTHPPESPKPWAPEASPGSPSAASSACSSLSSSWSSSCAAPTPRSRRSGWGRPRASKGLMVELHACSHLFSINRGNFRINPVRSSPPPPS